MQNNVWKKTMKFNFLGIFDARLILILSLACSCIGCTVGFIFTAENDGLIAAIFLIAIISLIIIIFTILEGTTTKIAITDREELKKIETKKKAEEAVPHTEAYDITPTSDDEVKIKKKNETTPKEKEAVETKEEPIKSEKKANEKEKLARTKKSKTTSKKSISTKKIIKKNLSVNENQLPRKQHYSKK